MLTVKMRTANAFSYVTISAFPKINGLGTVLAPRIFCRRSGELNMRMTTLVGHASLALGLFLLARDYFQFDDFSSIMLALNGVFSSIFARMLYRYQRRVGVGLAGERAVQQVLKDSGVEALHDIYLPKPDGSMQIDHVALFPGSLAVIETKTYNGRFDMDASGPWYRHGARRTRHEIPNPLWQLEAATKALSAALPGVRVWGLVVLAGNATSTTAYPKNVITLEGLRGYIADHRRRHGEWQFSDQIKEAWEQLNALKAEHASLGKTHVMNARKKRGERFYDFEEIWPLWLSGGLAAQTGALCVLAYWNVI